MKNYIKQSFGLVFIIFLVLVGLSFTNTAITVFGYTLKPVDLFSDLRKEKVDTALVNIPKVKPVFMDTCKTGLTCFEDYSADKSALKIFFDALCELDSVKKPLRIAFFGDSFIEGDILTATLRDSLQSKFGGNGVGFVPITSEVSQFRQTVMHTFSDSWTTYSGLNGKPTAAALGFSCNSYVPAAGSTVNYSGIRGDKHLRQFNSVNLFYGNLTAASNVSINLNSKGAQSYALQAGKGARKLTVVADSIKSAAFSFGGGGEVYGVTLEDTTGISVDNLSLRGNSGSALLNVDDYMLADFDSLRDYKLIILQYGLNVAAEGVTKFTGYENNMVKVIEKLKKNCPGASILLVSVSDRGSKATGTYATMKSIPYLVEAQRRIASKTGVGFWNLFEAMGGEGSMVTYADAKPALANKDYTHLKFAGGRKLAGILMQTILYEKFKHEQRKKSL
jgi:lysophospholipase L1-like esterase